MALDTKVGIYSKPHGTQSGGGGGYGIISGSDLPGDFNISNLTAANGYIENLTGKTLDFNDGAFLYLFSEDGTINKLRGESLNYKNGYIGSLSVDELGAGKITTDELNAEKAFITELNSKNITTEFLTVTKQAHFFELIIDKVKSVGGTILLTQANCVVDYAKPVNAQGTYLPRILVPDDPENPDGPKHYVEDMANPLAVAYDVFWMARDKFSGTEVSNDWVVRDQAYCQSFKAHEGVNNNISSRYYWRLVKGGLDDRYMNFSTGAELADYQTGQAAFNTVWINTPKVIYNMPNSQTNYEINFGWNVRAQNNIEGIETGATWHQDEHSDEDPVIGYMTTTNTIFGIQLQPITDSQSEKALKLSKTVPSQFMFVCKDENDVSTPARLNVGIYYSDDSSEFFPAPEYPTDTYSFILKKRLVSNINNNPVYESENTVTIEAIVITNADDVQWHLVHGIRLSNESGEMDGSAGTVSYPIQGDNLVQLGYRPTNADDPNKSRGNAIIISAYKTLDRGTGDPNDKFNKNPIYPPSYAQYEAIGSNSQHYFDLAYYRKTFMDAKQNTFRGNFFTSGTNQNIVDMIEQSTADSYYPFFAYCDNLTGTHILYPATNWNWAKSTNLPGGKSWKYMGTVSKEIVPQGSETPEQAIARTEAALAFNDYHWVEVGDSGTPGGNWVSCYKDTTDPVNAPTPPNVNGVAKHLDELPYNGWTTQPSQHLQAGYYTWMSQAFIDGNGSYQLWQTPVRLTGADGKDGEDGNDIEFIYTRNNGDQDGDPDTPLTPPNGSTYPDDWPSTYDQYGQKISDHDYDAYGQLWYDNPQGVGNYPADPDAFLFEYMCQRVKRNGEWSDYSDPVVWSNWGKKGQDGDGYEYIFKNYSSEQQSWASDDTNPAHWSSSSDVDSRGHYFDDDEYLGPVSQGWSDDPVGVSETQQFEYCSVRKKVDGEWGSFSEPSLWAHWAAPGTQGPEGPQGPQGLPGPSSTGWALIDKGSKAGWDLYPNDQNALVSNVAVNIMMQVCKTSGSTPEILTRAAVQNEGLNVYVLRCEETNYVSTVKTWYKMDAYDGDSYTFQYSFTPPYNWTDAQKSNFVNNNSYFLVALIPSNDNTLTQNDPAIAQLKDEISIPMLIATNAYEKMVVGQQASWQVLVTNVLPGIQGNTTQINQINQLISGPQGIEAQVTQLSTGMQGLENGLHGVQGTISNQGHQISAIVTDLNDTLEGIAQTGIDIENHTIDLYADKVNFYGTQSQQGTQGGKIWIDPNNGSLHAVDGDFSGKVTAENNNGNKIIINPTDPSIKGWESGYQSTYGNPAFEIKTVGYTTGNAASMEMRGPQTHGVFEGSRLQVEDSANGQTYIHLETGNDQFRPMIIIKGSGGTLQIGLYKEQYSGNQATKIYIKPSSSTMWPTQEEAERGCVWLDGGNYLRVKNW